MPPLSPEDILQLFSAGPREHHERPTVPMVYDPAQGKVVFFRPKKTVVIISLGDAYWVDSAADDADALAKLNDPDKRGFLPIRIPVRFSLVEGITRLDFRSRFSFSVPVFVTGM